MNQPILEFNCYYLINQKGEVWSRDRFVHVGNGRYRFVKGKLLTPRLSNRGYLQVRFYLEGVEFTRCVHRLLAEVFIPNPFKKPYVNHINGLKTDNRIENLEWVDHPQNIGHAYQLNLIKKVAKPVIDVCANKQYTSVKAAAKATGLAYSTCKNYLNGNRRNPTCLRLVV